MLYSRKTLGHQVMVRFYREINILLYINFHWVFAPFTGSPAAGQDDEFLDQPNVRLQDPMINNRIIATAPGVVGGQVSSLSACKSICLAEPNCRALFYTATSFQCILYTADAACTGTVVSTGVSSPVVFTLSRTDRCEYNRVASNNVNKDKIITYGLDTTYLLLLTYLLN